MKTHLLPASFAVAVMASAADLKDAAEVARESFQTPPPSPITDFSLKSQTREGFRPQTPPPRPASDYAQSPSGFSFDRNSEPPRPRVFPIPRDKIYDAPNYRVPDVLPDNMPPGTKLWKYGGGTYYLLPLIPAREK